VLSFEEVLRPHGQPGTADPAHRQAVRLTQQPVLEVDRLTPRIYQNRNGAIEDALAFPLLHFVAHR